MSETKITYKVNNQGYYLDANNCPTKYRWSAFTHQDIYHFNRAIKNNQGETT